MSFRISDSLVCPADPSGTPECPYEGGGRLVGVEVFWTVPSSNLSHVQALNHKFLFLLKTSCESLSVSKNNKIGRKKQETSLTKHPTANNRIWIMQQEFYYNKCLKNRGSHRHWALSAPSLQDVISDCALITKLCTYHPTSEAQGYCQRWLTLKYWPQKILMHDGCKNNLILGNTPFSLTWILVWQLSTFQQDVDHNG